MNDPDISVVMSVYNNAVTLPSALASILSQQGAVLEFIVIDDGSTDGSGLILDEVAAHDSRVRVIHKQNEGLTCALIDGCACARAPWIARQDADDISLPGRLAAQFARARVEDAPVLVGCGSRTVGADGGELMQDVPPVAPAAARQRLLDDGAALSPHGSILFRRDAYAHVGGYRTAFYYAQDIDLTMRLAEYGPVAAVPDILYEYRLSDNAISSAYGREQRAYYRLIRDASRLRRQGANDVSPLRRAEHLRLRCLRSRHIGGASFGALYWHGTLRLPDAPLLARAYFERALHRRPWSVKSWLRWLQAGMIARRGGYA